MKMKRRSTGAAVLLLMTLGSMPLSAQSLWRELSTLGYGGLGVGAGVLLSGDHLYAYDGKILLGAGAGMVIGHLIGSGAERRASEGLVPSPGRLWGVRVGTVAGMAAVGAGLAGIYIIYGEGNETGEDERNLRLGAILGAIGGGVLQYSIESKLRSLTPEAGPSLLLSPSLDGGIAIGTVWRVG